MKDWPTWLWAVLITISVAIIIKSIKYFIDEIIISYEVRHKIRTNCPYYNRLCGKCIRKPFSKKGKEECEKQKAMFQNAITTTRANYDFRPTCPECHGTGRYNGVCCDRCGGTGKLLV